MNKDKYPCARNPWERGGSPTAPGQQCHLQCPSPPQLSRFLLQNPQTTQLFPAQVCLSPNLLPSGVSAASAVTPRPLQSQRAVPRYFPRLSLQQTGEASPLLSAGFGGLAASPQESFPGVSPIKIPFSLLQCRRARATSGSMGSSWRVLWLSTGHHGRVQP